MVGLPTRFPRALCAMRSNCNAMLSFPLSCIYFQWHYDGWQTHQPKLKFLEHEAHSKLHHAKHLSKNSSLFFFEKTKDPMNVGSGHGLLEHKRFTIDQTSCWRGLGDQTSNSGVRQEVGPQHCLKCGRVNHNRLLRDGF